jgi:pimeloyl-ACP methyl ester carboxylesterase
MLAQTRAVLDQYRLKGGSCREVVFVNCGHSPHVEKADEFVKVLTEHIDACRPKAHQ